MQDLDGLLAQFDDERRAMMERYEALDAEAVALRQQLSAATLRCSELSMQNEQLLRSLERHKGALALVGCGGESRCMKGYVADMHLRARVCQHCLMGSCMQ